jgi:TonB-dependent receptor
MMRWFSVVALGVAVMAAWPETSAAQQAARPGTVAGQIVDKVQGEPLAGAEVQIDGTRFSAVTDQNGRYRVPDLPPGDYTLVVTFLGFGGDKRQITITPGSVTTADFQVSLTFGEEVTVSAPILEGQTRALNQQKTASNIVNVVSADQLAGFPDPNVAEAAQRVPGVSLQRDDGEGELMLIRGISPALNSMTMNGERIPSTESTSRAVNSISIASDILQTIEVTKSLRPDQDGDAIGGVVNFVTKQAPEVARLMGTLEWGYNDLRSTNNPKASVTWGRRFSQKRLGMIFSGSAQDESRANETIENEYTVTQQLSRVTFRDEYSNYQRYSANAAIDWLASSYTFTVRSTWTRQDQDKVRRRQRDENIPTGITGTGGRIRTELRDRTRRRDVFTNSLGGTVLFKNEWAADYAFAYNESDRGEPDTALNRYQQSGIRYAPYVDPEGRWAYINPNPQNFDPTKSTWSYNQTEQLFTNDRDLIGGFNLRIPLGSGFMKYGVKVRDKQKTNDQNLWQYSGSGLPTLAVAGTEMSREEFLDSFVRPGPFLTPDTMRGFFTQYTLTPTKTLSTDSFDYEADEQVLATYGMVELRPTNNLTVMGGLRFEYSSNDYTGKKILGTTVSPVTGEASQGSWLPALHLRYAFNDNTNLRFAVTRSIARPNYYDLVPYEYIDTDGDTISRGNPDLKVTDSTNIDVFVERYFSNVGVLGGGYFYKSLSDPIFVQRSTQDYQGEPYRVTEPVNGESGSISGLEVYYQQRLSFLPGFLNGFGVLGNYVYVTSDATMPNRPAVQTFPGQSDHSGNFALWYEKAGFTGRIAYNYSGKYLFELGEVALMDIWKIGHPQWDMTLTQRIGKRFSVYANVLNLNDARDREFWGVETQQARNEKYSWWSQVGLRFEF